jgi:hypothetical protein
MIAGFLHHLRGHEQTKIICMKTLYHIEQIKEKQTKELQEF